MRKITLVAILLLSYSAIMMAGMSIYGTGFISDSASVKSGIDSMFIVKTTDKAYLTYKSTEPFLFKWEAFDIQGNIKELKTETQAVDTTFVELLSDSTSGYRLTFKDDSVQTAWVFYYKPFVPAMDTLIVDSKVNDRCSNIKLQLYPKGKPTPAMEYKGLKGDGDTHYLPHKLTLNYNLTYYSDKEYITESYDTVCSSIKSLDAIHDIFVKSPLDSTRFTLYANQYALQFGDTIKVVSNLFEAIAVETHIFASVRIREEATNENDKGDPTEPTEETTKALELKGSAPLNFEALNYSSPAAFHYVWYLSQDKEYKSLIMKSYDKDFRYTFNEHGTYYLKAEVSNNAITEEFNLGCTQVREFTVEVLQSQLDVPNVFTPNGDGINDEFKVAYKSLIEFHGWIYSQWGRLVYQWTDPAQGWDGTINGKAAADGTYMYIIEATGDDYDTDGNRIKYLKRGAVSIVR